MNKANKLILESDGKEIVIFDFNETNTAKVINNTTNVIIGNRNISLVTNSKNEVDIEISATIREQIKIIYDNGVEQSLNELYSIQKMICNMQRISEFAYMLNCYDLHIVNDIDRLMHINDVNNMSHIGMLGVAEDFDEETVKPIEIGKYELRYRYSTAKVDSSCEKELTKEAMDIVREAINNYDITIELKIRPKK